MSTLNKKKIMFFGMGRNAADTLQEIFNDCNFEIVAVVPRLKKQSKEWFDEGVLEKKSLHLKIDVLVVDNVNEESFVNYLSNLNLDLIVNFGHGQLFKKDLISSTKFGILNYHPGLLPHGRGSGAIVGELLNGTNIVGRTCHLVDENFDLGFIVNQEKFHIKDSYSMSKVKGILEKNIGNFIYESIKKVFEIDPKEFQSLSNDFGRYYPKFVPGDEYIDWNCNSDLIYNKIRSRLNERYSIAILKENLEKVYIAGVEKCKNIEPYFSVNGQVINKSNKGILIKTGDTAIWITKVYSKEKDKIEIPKYKIGTTFLTINIYDFIRLIASNFPS